MVRERVSQKTKERFKRSITDFLRGLSESVLVYKTSLKSECPNCFYDKTTESSTGKCKWTALEARTKQQEFETASGTLELKYKFFKVGRCPVCKGKGYLEVPRKAWVNCVITYNPKNSNLVFTPSGIDGNVLIELKTDVKYFKLFSECDRLVVNGSECKLASAPMLRGIGSNSVLVVYIFTSNANIQNKTNDVLKDYTET